MGRRAPTGKLLERLEAKHWIERKDNAHDSQVQRVYLCDEVIPVFAMMAAEGRRLFRGVPEGRFVGQGETTDLWLAENKGQRRAAGWHLDGCGTEVRDRYSNRLKA
jgi:hypothetical protein